MRSEGVGTAPVPGGGQTNPSPAVTKGRKKEKRYIIRTPLRDNINLAPYCNVEGTNIIIIYFVILKITAYIVNTVHT